MDEIIYRSSNTDIPDTISTNRIIPVELFFASDGDLSVLTDTNGNTYVLDKISSVLYQIDNIKQVHLVATRGTGPDQIQNGLSLIHSGNGIKLLQRYRTSSLVCDTSSKCELDADSTFQEYHSYIASYPDGSRIAGLLHTNGIGSIIKTHKDTGLIRSAGGYLSHTDSEIATSLNVPVLTGIRKNNYLVQTLGPYILLFDEHLQTLRVLKLDHFKSFPIVLSYEDGKVTFNIDYDVENYSRLASYPIHDDRLLLSVEHIHSVKQSHNPDDVNETVTGYDYYLFDPDLLRITYVGSSDYQLFPGHDGSYMVKDYQLFHIESNLWD